MSGIMDMWIDSHFLCSFCHLSFIWASYSVSQGAFFRIFRIVFSKCLLVARSVFVGKHNYFASIKKVFTDNVILDVEWFSLNTLKMGLERWFSG